MTRLKNIPALFFILSLPFLSFSQPAGKVEYIPEFKNVNYPQIAYWFLTPDLLGNGKYLEFQDKIINQGTFDFIFLDARNGASFSNAGEMHPVLDQIVSKAHEKNIRIGYRTQVATANPLPEEQSERFIAEAGTMLDRSGQGSCNLDARFVRTRTSYRKEVFKVFAFKKTAAGFYDPSTLKEITDYNFKVTDQIIRVNVKAGSEFAGYFAYIMAGFYFKGISNSSPEAVSGAIQFMQPYADIAFDGVMLDEYGNYKLIPPWKLKYKFGNVRLRICSEAFANDLEKTTGEPAAKTLLSMRFAPDGHPEVRIKAINQYMDLMRNGPMHVENAMYKRAKELYGQDCFIAAHNTFHNLLTSDEIWATGIKWWSIPREFGFTDERTPTPTQMGIAMSYPAKAMYNMYYDGNIRRFTKKTLTDLRYGIRTFYHAYNDKQWGMGLEMPEAVSAIAPVENCARLMNRFNPTLPEIKLLIIFGNEALQNWYPDQSQRGRYDINDKLKIEEKAVRIWKAGYLNALVPTDLISSGKLKLDADHRPVLNGHRYDAIIFLYPQYAKESTLKFLEEYVVHGGKLMMEGRATHDFDGKDITGRFNGILTGSTETKFSVRNIPNLGIAKNVIKNGCKNEDGSYVFTDIRSLKKNQPKIFKININQDIFLVEGTGFAAIAASPQKGVEKFTCSGFRELKKNSTTLLKLNHPADIFFERMGNESRIIIAGSKDSDTIAVNRLN